MIRFSCPNCLKVMNTPDAAASRKVACPQCGQRLMVPRPAPDVRKTVLGKLEPDAAAPAPAGNVQAGMVIVGCPGCGRAIPLPPNELTWTIECSKCGQRFVPVPGQPAHQASANTHQDEEPEDEPRYGNGGFGANRTSTRAEFSNPSAYLPDVASGRRHSGLGIASFLIAVMVGGLDLVLAMIIASNVARSEYREEVVVHAFAGGMSMVCLNFLSLPLCLVGAGLGLVALVAHSGRNHVFTWIGLLGNGVVIVSILGLILLSAIKGH